MQKRTLQRLDINDLVTILAGEKGRALEITTVGGLAPAISVPGQATATINGHQVDYESMHDGARVVRQLLRGWKHPVTLNGKPLETTKTEPEWPHRLIVRRQSMGILGQPAPDPLELLLGNPQPTIAALGLSFSNPFLAGHTDWRNIHLYAPDPNSQWELFGLNVSATLTPQLDLPAHDTQGCQFFAHEDDPYIDLTDEASKEIQRQTEAAGEEAIARLTELTGATGWATAEDEASAAGTHNAMSYDWPTTTRITPRAGATIAIMAQNGAEESLIASAARALYQNPALGIVPVGGYYGAGASATAAVREWRVTRRAGDVEHGNAPENYHAEKMAPGRAANVELLIEFRPLRDGAAWEQRVAADVILCGYGDGMAPLVTDDFQGDVQNLANLIAHVSAPYEKHRGRSRDDHREAAMITALRALEDEEEAFRLELTRLARSFEKRRLAQPPGHRYEGRCGDVTLTWSRDR